jgi:hypothetical protein
MKPNIFLKPCGRATIVGILFIVVCGGGFHSCGRQEQAVAFNSGDIDHVITRMTEIMVHDVTNPPLAARFFSYACLAGYEVVAENDSSIRSMHGMLNDYPEIKKPEGLQRYDYQLSALLAMMETAEKMQPSGTLLTGYEKHFLDSLEDIGVPQALIEGSKKYAAHISTAILKYAKSDRYNMTTDYPRYTPMKGDGYWYPTPPGFFAAVEPYFNTIRPFTLDSAAQFKPAAPVSFDPAKNSLFYHLMMENYTESGAGLSEEKHAIAAFWDCNPFAMEDNGHLMVGLKKISPGAHWLGITGIACRNAGKSFDESMKIFTTVSIGLMDAFMCCWDEKYRSNRIRPETAIRKYIDPNWQPLLQTPPFPEYVSGHSVVSSASAVILGHFFGNHFSFTDDVERNYGLPPRNFSSFEQAAQEAAVSRFYGGIHFMDAIENGLSQGTKIGDWVLRRTQEGSSSHKDMAEKESDHKINLHEVRLMEKNK